MNKLVAITLGWIFTVVLCVVLSVKVAAQMLPPPPMGAPAANDSFTEADRRVLMQIRQYVRSIRAKLFPLEEEQEILKLRQQ